MLQGTWQFMSALALNDHKKPIRIEDELESFLHVLLHISVRFLPHNLADEHVPQFLHDYFDDYSAAGTERHCGTAKFAAMQLGFVGISQYKNKAEDPRQLKFLLPADTDAGPSTTTDAAAGETTRSTIEHPINGIIEPLLSWLSAHYALDLLEQESLTRRVGSDVAPDFTNGFMRLMAKARRPHKAKDTKDSPSAAQLLAGASTGATAPDRVVLTERARKLGSHTATLELLEIVLFQSDWPPLPDRVGERNPAKSRVLKTNDQVPKASFILGSRKRNTPESVSKDPPSPPIKKSKA
ncbi:hypothetical protein C8Q78DRAFT_462421 [Trametes maxima]|nr:hypothetical protein C8Q78DRAFT_462421 [Trametes maxima]